MTNIQDLKDSLEVIQKGCGKEGNIDIERKDFEEYRKKDYWGTCYPCGVKDLCSECKMKIEYLKKGINACEEILNKVNIPKEFDKEFRNCKCGRILSENGKYCDKCKKLVCNKMDEVGAGVLLGDVKIEILNKENTQLKSENSSLKVQLENKSKSYKQIKQALSQRNQDEIKFLEIQIPFLNCLRYREDGEIVFKNVQERIKQLTTKEEGEENEC